MTGLRRSALFLIAALLVLGFADAGTTASAQAQDKGRGRDKASPAPPDDKGARVDEAMRVSGIRSHLALVRIRMKQILDEDAGVEYDARRWLAQTLDVAFSPEAFAQPIRQALLDGYDGDSLSRVLVWYRSALGRKIARLEQAATEPGIAQARKVYLASLENKQPSDYRLVLIFSLDEASRASEGTFDAEKAAVNGWNRGSSRSSPARSVRKRPWTRSPTISSPRSGPRRSRDRLPHLPRPPADGPAQANTWRGRPTGRAPLPS